MGSASKGLSKFSPAYIPTVSNLENTLVTVSSVWGKTQTLSSSRFTTAHLHTSDPRLFTSLHSGKSRNKYRGRGWDRGGDNHSVLSHDPFLCFVSSMMVWAKRKPQSCHLAEKHQKAHIDSNLAILYLHVPECTLRISKELVYGW